MQVGSCTPSSGTRMGVPANSSPTPSSEPTPAVSHLPSTSWRTENPCSLLSPTLLSHHGPSPPGSLLWLGWAVLSKTNLTLPQAPHCNKLGLSLWAPQMLHIQAPLSP